ncbi:hypothetical protein GQ85_34310 [Rhodococcus rhodochrous]|nr:hypothetical protein GQ85_34310 [Rhodococcus rhodochrous]
MFGEEFVLDDTDAAARRVLEATAVDARWDALSALARDRVRSYDERVVAGLWREALGLADTARPRARRLAGVDASAQDQARGLPQWLRRLPRGWGRSTTKRPGTL